MRQIQKNLENICYSCYKSSKAGRCLTFLVSFIMSFMAKKIYILLCYVVQDIFKDYSSNLREAQPNMALFFSKVSLRKIVLACKLFVLRSYFIDHLTAKRPTKISWLPLQFIIRSGWLKLQSKRKIRNYTSLF